MAEAETGKNNRMNNNETSGTENVSGKTSGAQGAPAAGEEGAKAKPARRVVQAKPKKKKIIIVTAGNGGGNGGRAAAPSGRRAQNQGTQHTPEKKHSASGAGTFTASTPVHRIIRPKTVPTQMDVDFHAPDQRTKSAEGNGETIRVKAAQSTAPLKAEEVKKKAAAAEAVSAAAVESAAAEVPSAEVPAAQKPAAEAKPAAAEKEEKAGKVEETVSAGTSEKAPKGGEPSEPANAAAKAEPKEAPAKPAEQKPAEQKSAEQKPAKKTTVIVNDSQPGKSVTRTVVRSINQIPYIQDPAERLHRNGQNPSAGRGTGRGNIQSGYNRGGQGSNNRTGQGGYSRSQSSQGGYQGRSARPGQGYTGGRGSFGARPGQGGFSGGRGGQGTRSGSFAGGKRPAGRGAMGGGDAFVKDSEKHRDADRRKAGQERDKRNRKDYMYTDEDVRAKKPGRFVKPEKVEEAPEEQIKTISVPDKITIRDLAAKMHMHDAEIIKKLFLEGKVTTPNTELSYDEASNIAVDFDILCEKEEKVDVIKELLKDEEDPEDTLVPRAPVVCVMGHVDHGKTTLLDYIRAKSLGITDEDKKERERKMAALSVANKEAGGITQAIGAYQVDVKGRKITFLDTPGHEAFTAMRMRGANSTDIAILVVAADDGVMPQTIEAINHAKAAGIEIIVAVNKIDKPGANVDLVKQELTKYDLVATDWGGSTEFVPVSAKTGQGVDDLLDTVLLTADILELKANPNRRARGLVLEARLDKGRGPVANVLVQKGTLHIGDFISAGAASGKVRAMIDDKGRNVRAAGPSTPVEVLGLSEAPSAGEVIIAHDGDKEAKQFAAVYRDQHKEDLLEENRMHMSLDDLFTQMKEGNLKEFNIIIKADVQGSVEALKSSLLKLSNDEIAVKCIHSGVGAITESDVSLASASDAIIIGFNVKPDAVAKAMAEREGVDVHVYDVIYTAIDEVEAAIKGMEAPVYEESIIGHAEIRQIFHASQVGNIAGASVTDGLVRRGCKCRITRDGKEIFNGGLASLKRFKDDVKEVKEGFECGLVFDGFDAINVGDMVEAYEMVKVTGDRAAEIKAQRRAEAAAKAQAAKDDKDENK